MGGLARGAKAENFMDFASRPILAARAASAADGVWVALGTYSRLIIIHGITKKKKCIK